MLYYAALCYAMLCYTMLYYAMLCYAVPCYARLPFFKQDCPQGLAVTCREKEVKNAMLCYAMLCYAILLLLLLPPPLLPVTCHVVKMRTRCQDVTHHSRVKMSSCQVVCLVKMSHVMLVCSIACWPRL